MLNHITVMGRLTRDPELRRTQNGIAVASFSIACDRDYKPEGGERETDFIEVVAWRSTAEFVCKYFTKGRMAVVSGRLQVRPWTDKDGNKRKTAEIVADNCYFGDSKREGDGGQAQGYGTQGYGGYGQTSFGGQQPGGYGYGSGSGGNGAPAPYGNAAQQPAGALHGFYEKEDDGNLPF
ncbi:MAG: single-stranded DNA-binding protein [Oscillospiraceae bacterium]|nr:single-stranded DNA-binding protein [Oscillospiraceae bacterium]